MMTLEAAANSAHEIGKRERLAMVIMADGRDALADPTAWFAASIARIVPIYVQRADGSFETLDKSHLGGELGTAAEIAALGLPSLYIQKRDLQTYMRWARTLQ